MAPPFPPARDIQGEELVRTLAVDWLTGIHVTLVLIRRGHALDPPLSHAVDESHVL